MQVWRSSGQIDSFPEKRHGLDDLSPYLSVPFAVLCTAIVPDLGRCMILGTNDCKNLPNKKATLVVGRPVYGDVVVLKEGTEIR